MKNVEKSMADMMETKIKFVATSNRDL